MYLTGAQIRRRFLDFFKAKGHAVLPSASLVPDNDPTVLFTTAGMHPLVPYLLGQAHPQGPRLASSQKCVRTGDIEEVGDNRHLTYFEMLGNWSLGDYFKKESINWSFHFLTSKDKGLGFEPDRLYITVFAGDTDAPQDKESIGIWKEVFKSVGIDAKVDQPIAEGGRIFTMPKASNWWGPAGQTGPCGPDTEIHYDIQNEAALTDGKGMPDFDSGRLVEIWNNVFMQYNKTADGTFHHLHQHAVDTGMGLERITMILQGVQTPFETDLFMPLIEVIRQHLPLRDHNPSSERIIADHIRAAVVLVSDGVLPSNKDRGYVLRRLIRRAVMHAASGAGTDWVHHAVQAVAGMYNEALPEIARLQTQIIQSLTEEVTKFQRTIDKGLVEIQKRQRLTGKEAFDLYQSYGFPLELTKEYAQSKGIVISEKEFEQEFKKHQDLSRTASAGQFSSGLADHSDATVRYHTATHLLHQALRNVLGPEVQQRGSNLTAERLRFDFSWPEKLTPDQIKAIETEVNAQIKAGLDITSKVTSPDTARAEGAIGLFGHKYGSSVSVYTIGRPDGTFYSKEICTGPHVANTKELGIFSIVKEEAVSAGVRRIKAVLS